MIRPHAKITAAQRPTTRPRQPHLSNPVTRPDAAPCTTSDDHERKIRKPLTAVSSVDQGLAGDQVRRIQAAKRPLRRPLGHRAQVSPYRARKVVGNSPTRGGRGCP
jgi:hypothetical protein